MEIITLATAALSLATPFLVKAGEKISENVGESIWNLIKKPFTKREQEELETDIQKNTDKEKIIEGIIAKLNSDQQYKVDLENAVNKAQQELATYYQQNITNNGDIEKQVNIQNVTGIINL